MNLALILLLALQLPPAPAPIPSTPVLELAITGPDQAKAGTLVKLTATGNAEQILWELDPAAGAEACDRTVFFAAPPGTYRFFVCGRDAKSLAKASHTVTVTGAPQPGPGPGPQPPANLTAMVRTWFAVVKTPAKGDEARKLAASMSAVAAQISAGVLPDAKAVVTATAASNRAALGPAADAWRDPFFVPLSAELTRRGALTPAQYAEVYRELAEALEAAAAANEPTPAKQTSAATYLEWYTGENCVPCRKMRPVLEAMQRDGFDVRKIEDPVALAKANVTLIPTFIGHAGGRETGRIVGETTRAKLEALLR